MKAKYPPSSNIYGRFDQTQGISVRITNVSQGNGVATVGVALAERRTDGTVNGYVGSWHLVQASSGWLLDSVDLTPAQVSNEGQIGQTPHGPDKHQGHGGNQGNG